MVITDDERAAQCALDQSPTVHRLESSYIEIDVIPSDARHRCEMMFGGIEAARLPRDRGDRKVRRSDLRRVRLEGDQRAGQNAVELLDIPFAVEVLIAEAFMPRLDHDQRAVAKHIRRSEVN